MPLMGKDVDVAAFPWLADSGLSADQIDDVWTYTRGEPAPQRGRYCNLLTGEMVTLEQQEPFPSGRWARADDLPSPRFKDEAGAT